MNFETVSQVIFTTRFAVAAGHLASQLHPSLTKLRFAIVERHRFLRRLARPRPAVEQRPHEARPA
jgi:hypothetical protein